MNKDFRKGVSFIVSIGTALVFFVSGCGMIKPSQMVSSEKPFVASNLYIGEKKPVEQPVLSTGGQTKAMAQSASEQQQTKVMAQSASEPQMKEVKKSPAVKKSDKQSKTVGKIYVVKKGDSLWKIAKSVYGNPLKWKAIYKANKKKIKKPNLIYVNQEFIIPEL
jgi:nucleoid-associated protein YgaU